MKIHKRKGLFSECGDVDVVKSARKHPKVRGLNSGATLATREAVVIVAVLEIHH